MRVVGGEPAVGQHHVQPQVRRVIGQQLDVLGRGEPGRLLGGLEVERQDAAGGGGVDRLGQLRHQQVRDDRGEPGPRPEHNPVRVEHHLE
jgi:hypothetical protein